MDENRLNSDKINQVVDNYSFDKLKPKLYSLWFPELDDMVISSVYQAVDVFYQSLDIMEDSEKRRKLEDKRLSIIDMSIQLHDLYADILLTRGSIGFIMTVNKFGKDYKRDLEIAVRELEYYIDRNSGALPIKGEILSREGVIKLSMSVTEILAFFETYFKVFGRENLPETDLFEFCSSNFQSKGAFTAQSMDVYSTLYYPRKQDNSLYVSTGNGRKMDTINKKKLLSQLDEMIEVVKSY